MIVIPWIAAAYVPDERDRELCDDVKLAMQRADLSFKAVAIAIGVSLPKLSEQLNGHLPFTALIRFTRLPDVFWRELLMIRGARFGGMFVVQPELVSLIAAVRAIGGSRTAKAALPSEDERKVS